MTLLEIVISSLPEKQIELIQTLNSLLGKLQQYSSKFSIATTGNRVKIIVELENQEQLKKFLASNDCSLLWGAISTLGTGSKVYINGVRIKDVPGRKDKNLEHIKNNSIVRN